MYPSVCSQDSLGKVKFATSPTNTVLTGRSTCVTAVLSSIFAVAKCFFPSQEFDMFASMLSTRSSSSSQHEAEQRVAATGYVCIAVGASQGVACKVVALSIVSTIN